MMISYYLVVLLNYDGLEIYHDSNNSYITDSGSGNLLIGSDNDLWITNAAGTENKVSVSRMVVSIFTTTTPRNLKPLELASQSLVN